MNKALQEMTKQWMQLERKTLEQRKEADEFYETNLLELISEDYIARNKELVFEDIRYMVISVGTSYEPIILNIRLLQPEKILFLYTDLTESVLNKVVMHCELQPNMYGKSKVSETSPVDIYKEIKESYIEWDKPSKMYIDFTGGTKAMSAAAAMAGAVIDVQLVYVGSDNYLSDFRKPCPGSEKLCYITNPLAIFGDLEIEKAYELFREFNYSGAVEKLETLIETIPDSEIRQQLNFVCLLAKSYEAWDSLDFITAKDNMTSLNKELKRDSIHHKYMLMDLRDRLLRQEEILVLLEKIPELLEGKNMIHILQDKEIIIALMFTMYQNAMVREEQGKYDMATLLCYRLLEMIEQKRLSNYNLFVSRMDYEQMHFNIKRRPDWVELSSSERVEALRNELYNVKKALFRNVGNVYLLDQVSLMEGFMILYVLRDPICYQPKMGDYVCLKKIRGKVNLRNNSIFAHGLGPVSKKDYEAFRDFVKEMFILFCKIEKVDFNKYVSEMEYITPFDSVNYSSNTED